MMEELHPELRIHLIYNNGIPGILHPLIYSVFHTPEQNSLINLLYENKKKDISLSLVEKNWDRFIFLHERPYRVNAFLEIEKRLSDEEYWGLLSRISVDSENIWQNKRTWGKLLSSGRNKSEKFMSKDEIEVFSYLPDELTVYRGYVVGKNPVGWSYTLKKEKANWFASRFSKKNGKVKTIMVKKINILAIKIGRNEEEIVLREPK